MTSNCLMPPRRKYRERLFTTNAVGYEGIKHIDLTNTNDMKALIESAQSCDGWDEV